MEEAAYYVIRIAETVEMHPDRAIVVRALIDEAPPTSGSPDPALLDRVSIMAVLQRGLAAKMLTRFDEAKAWFRHAAEAGDPNGYNELGNLLDDLGEHDGAYAAWHTAAEAGNESAAGNLAHFCEQHGDPEGAEIWWRRAGELGLRDANARSAQLHARSAVEEMLHHRSDDS